MHECAMPTRDAHRGAAHRYTVLSMHAVRARTCAGCVSGATAPHIRHGPHSAESRAKVAICRRLHLIRPRAALVHPTSSRLRTRTRRVNLSFCLSVATVRAWLTRTLLTRARLPRPLAHSFTLPVIEGQKIGLRINNSNIVCAVHPNTAAATAGLHVGDLVVAVDGSDCTADVTAVQLWAAGAGRPARKLRVVRPELQDH